LSVMVKVEKNCHINETLFYALLEKLLRTYSKSRKIGVWGAE